jgi:hypothetical protein
MTQDGIINMMRDHTGFFGLAMLTHHHGVRGAVILMGLYQPLKTYAVTLSLHLVF